MSLGNILLQTYEECEKNGLVDNSEEILQKTVLLPIYHSNKRSDGKNIFEISLDIDGNAVSGDFLPKENDLGNDIKLPNYIIFPVTGDSISRSSGPCPHPLVDELKYLDPVEEKREGLYIEQLKEWLDFEENIELKKFITIIYDYISSGKITEDIISFISKGNEKKYDEKKQVLEVLEEENGKIKSSKFNLGTTTITFKIIGFQDYKNISINNYKELHKSYIKFQEYLNKDLPKEICNISGKKMYCSPKHRGMMGTAKIIGGGHRETHIGRFKEVEEIVKIGFETSNKIHNMLKFLLENKNTSIIMGGGMDGGKLLTWFSNDIYNNRKTNPLKPMSSLINLIEEEESDFVLEGEFTKKLLNKAKGLYQNLNGKEKVYLLMLDKISNGRISIKYFYQGLQRTFYENMDKWYESFYWEFYDSNEKRYTTQRPNLYQVLDTVYGIELNGKLSMPDNKNKVKENLLTGLIPCVVEGKKIPVGIVKQSFENVKMRQRYKKKYNWNRVISMSCAVLNKYKRDYKKEEVNILLDRENKNRDYVYGRILAILEYMEETGLGETNRLTNIDRLWNSYINTPGKTLKLLMEKGKPYWNRMKRNNMGLFIIRQKEMEECFDLLAKSGEENKNIPLNEDFIFGYYGQRKEFYTKKEKIQED